LTTTFSITFKMEKILEKIKTSGIIPLKDSEQVQIKGGCRIGDKRTPRPGGGTTSLTQVGISSSCSNYRESDD
jgi:hypothetical protein